jgi:hypothetical protein
VKAHRHELEDPRDGDRHGGAIGVVPLLVLAPLKQLPARGEVEHVLAERRRGLQQRHPAIVSVSREMGRVERVLVVEDDGELPRRLVEHVVVRLLSEAKRDDHAYIEAPESSATLGAEAPAARRRSRPSG